MNYKTPKTSYRKRKSMDLGSVKTPQKDFRLKKSVFLQTNKVNLSPKINYQIPKNKNTAM